MFLLNIGIIVLFSMLDSIWSIDVLILFLDMTRKYFWKSDLNNDTWYTMMLGIYLNISIAF